MQKLSGFRGSVLLALAVTVICSPGSVGLLSAGQSSKSSETAAGNAENGKKLFLKHGCYECHGREGQGSVVTGPRIAPDPVPFDEFARYLRRPTGEMPPYTAQVVPDQELPDIYAFLQSRPHPAPAKNNPLLK
jgi:ubiquinol-cytochrome c reductase cytochrome c subunit